LHFTNYTIVVGHPKRNDDDDDDDDDDDNKQYYPFIPAAATHP